MALTILYNYTSSNKFMRVVSEYLMQRGCENTYACRNSKKGCMEYIRDHHVDVVIAVENMLSGEYSAEEYVYMKYDQPVRVIPIIKSAHKKDQYVKTLLINGIYDALYISDMNASDGVSLVADLIMNGRTYMLAQSYYGI